MAHLLEVPLEDGGSITVEVEEGPRGTLRSARPDEVVATAGRTLEATVERIGPASRAIVGKLKELAEPPDEIGVEFGMKLNAEAGVIIARTSGEANFKISLTWKRA